jgi:antitoxin FitA
MPTISVRDLPEETHRALRVRAVEHRRSIEAEVRAILEETVRPAGRRKIGTELHRLAQDVGGMGDLVISRERIQIKGADFE